MSSPTVTLFDKLAIIPLIIKVITSVTFSLFTAPFRDPAGIGAPTLREHVHNAAIRAVTSTIRVGTAQWISPTFLDTYTSWCRKTGRTPDILEIAAPGLPNANAGSSTPRVVKCFWVGDRVKANYVMVYTHGGGFVFAGSAQHLKMVNRWVGWSQGKLAVLCVCYSLSPGAVYPIAVGETVEALRWILSPSGGNRSAGQVLLGGDSAGGNLALAVLSHISGHTHPNAKLVKSLELSENLKGVLLIAPWISADEKKYASVRRLKYRDIIGPGCATYWSKAYMGVGQEDEYMWAALAGATWWKGVKSDDILVLAGEEEMLVDAILDFTGKLEKGAKRGTVKVVVGKKETHAQPLLVMDQRRVIELGDKCQEGAILQWIQEKIIK